jgi:D-alanyl-lipoteichoic acid acyltransferase DltB (MBOAT superfamily)
VLFNSHEFVFGFLPVALAGFWVLGALNRSHAALLWLLLASLFFYAFWRLADLWVLLASIALNYLFSRAIVRRRAHGKNPKGQLIVGIALNLALLGYFKYSAFFVQNLDYLTPQNWTIQAIALPLGISFFTFQQIAFLIEAARGEFDEPDFLRYSSVVTFFPHLIAGPIINYQNVISQFKRPGAFRPDQRLIAFGVSIFVLGLAKKVLLADTVGGRADWTFDAALRGEQLSFMEAWIGALSYTLQLYFDFSGYSDMAIGLALLFGIRLPINFNSPYKAHNIVEFWRRWHITLSCFLRDYLYIPLGGNRRGPIRNLYNLMITMLLGGLWHGAGWTFICWGAIHGFYILIHRTWTALKRWMGFNAPPSLLGGLIGRALTFGSVVIAWVFFRAASMDTALRVLGAMFPFDQIAFSQQDWQTTFGSALGARQGRLILLETILPMLLVVFVAPNTQEWVGYRPHQEATPRAGSGCMPYRPSRSMQWLWPAYCSSH